MTKHHPMRTQGAMPSPSQPSNPETERPSPSEPAQPSAESYTDPFLSFISDNPTVFHAISHFSDRLESHGYTKLSERDLWASQLSKGGKYYVERNGSALIAFAIGKNYKVGAGAAIIAAHIDALTARLKPISKLETKTGYVQLGVAPYAGGLNNTWWDRDLGIGGRVLVRDHKTGKISTRLVKLGWPIARIPTLAPHFGAAAAGPFNQETQMVPVIGLDNSDMSGGNEATGWKAGVLGGVGTFTATQPERLVKAIAGEMGIADYSTILNWELELFDTQPAQLGGLDKEFIFAGRIDDKLCSFSAIEALLASTSPSSTTSSTTPDSGIIRLVALFDDEEIGSGLRQGARSNFLSSTLSRITDSFTPSDRNSDSHHGAAAAGASDILAQTFANSFLISADVTHAVNPNFLSQYLEHHAPRLNVGVTIAADSNGHMTTDAVSTALLQRVAELCASRLQLFQIRNDSRSGGTVGPMLSAATGVRAVDAGLPQLSMHSIRAATGRLDPGLGVRLFRGFLERFEEVDAEFRG